MTASAVEVAVEISPLPYFAKGVARISGTAGIGSQSKLTPCLVSKRIPAGIRVSLSPRPILRNQLFQLDRLQFESGVRHKELRCILVLPLRIIRQWRFYELRFTSYANILLRCRSYRAGARARLILARRHGADLLKTAEARVVMHVLDSSRQISKPAAIAGDRSKNTHPQTSITIIFHLYFLSPQ